MSIRREGQPAAFSTMLAEYCSVEDYGNWVNEPEEETAVSAMQEE